MTARSGSVEEWHRRVDRGELLRPHIRADGLMLVEGVAVKECVLSYRRADGSIFRELVPLQTIVDSAAGIAHLPLCLHHADEKVTPDNVDQYNVGNVTNKVLVADGGFTHVQIAIRTQKAQQAVLDGTDELSLSYDAWVDPTPGVHPVYGAYDGVQKARKYDHLALVDQARVGPDARVRTDSAVSTTVIRADSTGRTPAATSNQGRTTARGGIVDPLIAQMLARLGITQRADDDAAGLRLIDAELARRDAAEEAEAEKDDAVAAELATVKADNARLKTENDTLKAAKADADDRADHAELAPLATALGLDPAATPKGRDLRKAIALARVPTLKADATDAHIDVAVEMARADHADGQADGKGTGRDAGARAWEAPEGRSDNSGTARPARPTRRPWGRSPSATNKEA